MVERQVEDLGVGGSIPSLSAIKIPEEYFIAKAG